MLDQRTAIAKHTRFIGLGIVFFTALAMVVELLD